MKILYIGNMNDIHTPKWAQWFIDNGHCVMKCHLDGLLDGFAKIGDLKRAIRTLEPDIIHAHYAGSWGLIGTLVKGHIPYVVTAHGSEILLTRGVKRFIVGWILRQADLVTADSNIVHLRIRMMGVNKEKIKIVRFGVDVDKYRAQGAGRRAQGEKRIVVFRTGEGKIYDEKTVLKTIEYIRDQGVYNIEFIPLIGLDETGMIRTLQTADLYISTALSDAGIASTTAEAMSCELPVIVANNAENRKWVTYYENFDSEMLYEMQLFEPKDHITLAHKIMWFCERGHFRKYFGELNRMRIKEHNDYHREMSKMQTLYQEVGNGKKNSGRRARGAGHRE